MKQQYILIHVSLPNEKEGKKERVAFLAFLNDRKVRQKLPKDTILLGESTWMIPPDNKLLSLSLLVWAAHSCNLEWSIRFLCGQELPDAIQEIDTATADQTDPQTSE